jgi:insertion element IS1 protein InsB
MPALSSVNQRLLALLKPEEVEVVIRLAGETEAEADEMWSFVRRKNNQRWLWHAIDHHSVKFWLTFLVVARMKPF